MQRWSHDLTYDECLQWMKELECSWEELLKAAKIDSKSVAAYKDNLKTRWAREGHRTTKQKIRAGLEALENKRKKRTETGARIFGVESWHLAGEELARHPAQFVHLLARVQSLARVAEKKHGGTQTVREADETMEREMAPFLTTT